MQNLIDWLSGKKTYFIAALIILGAALVLLTSFDLGDVPGFVWYLLNAAGLVVVRDGIDAASVDDNKGWKTYLAAGLIAVIGGLRAFGIILPPELFVAIEAFGIMGVRAAVNKII